MIANKAHVLQLIITKKKSCKKREMMQKIESISLIGLKNNLEKSNSPQFAPQT
jgi:hypothetical protein